MSSRPYSSGFVWLAAALILFAVGASLSASGQVPTPQEPFARLVERWNSEIAKARQVIAQPEITPQQLRTLTLSVEGVKREAGEYGDRSTDLLESANRRLRSLGPTPAEGEPSESESIVALREELEDDVAFYRARVQQADLAIAKADQILRDLVLVRGQQFSRVIFQKGPYPLSLSTWNEANRQAREAYEGKFSSRLYAGVVAAREAGYGWGYLTWMLTIPLLLLALGWPVHKWILKRYGHDETSEVPSYTRRVLAVFVKGLVRGLLWVLVPVLPILAIPAAALNEDVTRLVNALLVGLAFLFIVGHLVKAAFSPDAPQWRIVPITPDASRVLGRRLLILTVGISVFLFLGILSHEAVSRYPEYRAVESVIWAFIICAILLSLLQRRLWFPDVAADSEEQQQSEAGIEAQPAQPHWFRRALPPVLAMVIVTVPFIALAGYARLAEHITVALIFTALLIGALLLAREMVGELIEWLLTPTGQRQGVAQKLFTLSDKSGGVLVFWIRTGLNLGASVLALLGALVAWGIHPSTLRLWISSAMEGITFGELTIAPGQVVFAALLFVALMTGTRFLQRWLGGKFLPRTQIHAHVQHSLTAAVGYVGVTLAAVLSIASLGLSVANLALIAGALSVGIGFGLQSIVNNFVSGLILLVERPVSVGDWVIVGGHEGYVKRINIRSTEIQTFSRATVILPNSEILSTSVINYTHRDRYGRIQVPVHVARDSNPEQVQDVLMGCLHKHPLILAWPEPFVLFTDFGESSLQFEARGFLADVENSIMVRSELRFSIEHALREAGIEIPFPQRDLHIKTPEGRGSELESPAAPGQLQEGKPRAATEDVVELGARSIGRRPAGGHRGDAPAEEEP